MTITLLQPALCQLGTARRGDIVAVEIVGYTDATIDLAGYTDSTISLLGYADDYTLAVDYLLLETGDKLLLETGDKLLLE